MIAILDSGVGGLTVYQHVAQTTVDIIYIADTAYMPYGNLSSNQVFDRLCKQITWVESYYQVYMVVLACNTASIFVTALQSKFKHLVIVDVIQPTLHFLHTAFFQYRKLGVFATPLVTQCGVYTKSLQNNFQVQATELPFLAKAIERQENVHVHIQELAHLIHKQNLEIVVLGCTHYGFIEHSLRELLEVHIQIVRSDMAIGSMLKKNIKPGKSNHIFYVTGSSAAFKQSAQQLLDLSLSSVRPLVL